MKKPKASEEELSEIVSEALGQSVWSARPLTGGFNNDVYLVEFNFPEGQFGRKVLRLSRNSRDGAIDMAEILSRSTLVLGYECHGEVGAWNWMLMRFVDGQELCNALPNLDSQSQVELARQFFEQQNLAAAALEGKHKNPEYGYAQMLEPDGYPCPQTWHQFLDEAFCEKDGLEQWMATRHEAREIVSKKANLLNQASIQPFLWDFGFRNAMVKDGRLVGIIDQDSICYGDRLWAAVHGSVSAKAYGIKAEGFYGEWLRLERSLKASSVNNFEEVVDLLEMAAAADLMKIGTAKRENAQGMSLDYLGEKLAASVNKNNAARPGAPKG